MLQAGRGSAIERIRRQIPDGTGTPRPPGEASPGRGFRRRGEGERRGILRRQVIGVAAGCVDCHHVLEPLVEAPRERPSERSTWSHGARPTAGFPVSMDRYSRWRPAPPTREQPTIRRSSCWSACRRKSRTANTGSGWCRWTVRELTASGHHVIVETGAGLGGGLADADYHAVGAEIVPDAGQVYGRAELIVKVKEPLARERERLQPGKSFTYLHLAADPAQTADLMASRAIAIAYETVTSAQGHPALLTPMSEVAGRMAPHVGARCLEKDNGGRGVLLGGVPGVPPADVVVLGGGVAGTHAALISAGMGATVTVIDRNPEALRRIARELGGRGAHRVLDHRRGRDPVPARRPRSSHRCSSPAPRLQADQRRYRQSDEARRRHR